MKNKILTITFLFLFVLLIFNVNSYASNSLIVEEHDMSDIYNHFSTDDAFFIYIAPGTTKYFFYKPTSAYPNHTYYNSRFSENTKGTIFYCDSSFNQAYKYEFYSYNTSTQKFEYQWTGDIDGGHNISNMIIVYSSKGIYNADHTTFFINPPVAEQPETTTLKPILEKVEMKEPIMTTIVGLAKLLIPFLICLIGFWKAWQLLLKILHKS